MDKPKLLQEIEVEYQAGKLNIRKFLPKMKEKEFVEFFKDKFPTAKTISEKVYLYLNKMTNPPEGKVFDFQNFQYVEKKTTKDSASETKDVPHLVIFDERLFIQSLQSEKTRDVFFTSYSTNTHQYDLGVFCIPNLTYFCRVPKTLNVQALKVELKKMYDVDLLTGVVPLEVVANVNLQTIELCNELQPMAFILTRKHTLYD